ncbi:Dyp-type peroxidase [Kitasatospora sp. CM 4170]|uniref:Dyp-type peroxidase n=1 Tax=Kitasatospora aburaviensis TaxID=67265 RepID=A0ABW1ETE5_9ACTN|nr:Dyp-type peroxidase [Kitasatospora sp. CM 4170]WNM44367.1 Dyp-type peroxidase [Kitasatospora sp. CM 4170]
MPPTPGVPAAHQAGVTTVPPAAAEVAAYRVTAAGRDGLADVLRRLGAEAAGAGAGESLTVSAGASLFDQRYGLAALRPRRLTEMPAFPSDVLDPAWCHGDLTVQACAATPERAAELAAQAARVPGLERTWRMPGFRPGNETGRGGRAFTTNLFGFREGAGNLEAEDTALMDRQVWVRPGADEPAWTAGGTYQVIRLIRFAMPLWDADPVPKQEAVIGRHKDSAAPLGATRETDTPDYAHDPEGRTISLDSHIRRANPRTPDTDGSRILRRSYSYRLDRDATGHDNAGLLFVCYQHDVEQGFATVQRRLHGEALEKYVLPFGGGYYFTLPGAGAGTGAGNGGDHLGAALLAAAG